MTLASDEQAREPVTIVTPVWNAEQVTRNYLVALKPTVGPDDQVVVVNNGSHDGTARLLAQHDWIEVVTHKENKGFAGGSNAGAQRARHPIIVFLNNDTLPTPGWIESLTGPFADPTVGAAGPMSNSVNGPQHLDDDTYCPTSLNDIAAYSTTLRDRAAGQTQETLRLVGFCLAVRRPAFIDIGGFDETFGLGGYEDDDLCLRLRFAGWRLVVAMDSFIHHIGHQTFDSNQVDWYAIQQQNEPKMHAKIDAAPPLSFLVLAGDDPRALIATLVGIEQTMVNRAFEVVLLVPDPEPLREVLQGVGGVKVVDVAGLPEDEAWQLGQHRATGLRRATLRAGQAVDVSLVYRLLASEALAVRPTAVGLAVNHPEDAGSSDDDKAPSSIVDAAGLYLDLMKKCLLNLIYEDAAQDPWSEQRFDAGKRAGGLDWPSQAHSMIGERRMDNLQWAVQRVLADQVPGDLIETGVWRGGACILMRAVLKAHGITGRRVFVADSFEGLPPPDPEKYPADAGDQHHTFEPLAVSLEQVQANFAKYDLLDEQVVFLRGWFKNTLATAPIDRLAVLRLDGDMYESTMDALGALYDKVSRRGFVIVDDYALPGCRQAIHDFRNRRGIGDPLVPIDSMSVYWQKS